MNATISRVALGALILLNVALGAFAVQLAAGKVPVPETWAWAVPILLAVVTAATALLPRAGSEGIAQQVDALREQGYHRADLTVVPKDQATPAVMTGSGSVVSPDLSAWHPVVHADCGRVAFLTIAPNTAGEHIGPGEAMHADGTPLDLTGQVACGSCGAALGGAHVAGGVWVCVSKGEVD